MHKKALIIANRYYRDNHFQELPGAVQDAEQLESVLSDRVISEFVVEKLIDQPGIIVMKQMEGFFSGAGPDDLLLLHLSCHGWRDLQGRLSFVVTDTELNYLYSSAISAGFIGDLMERSYSKRIVVMLDCCYSGAFVRGMRTRTDVLHVDVGEPLSGRGRVVMTSATALQVSYENEMYSRDKSEPALFTAAVVSGLREGMADLNGDGYVDVQELYTFVREQVTRREPSQTPTQYNSVDGNIYLTRAPWLMRPRPIPGLPNDLWDAIISKKVWLRQGAMFEIERLLETGENETLGGAREAMSLLVRDPD